LTPERWQHVARILDLALDQDESARDAFLSEACAGDESLRCEVQSLLRHKTAEVVLDRSLWATAAPLLDDGFDVGTCGALGPYRIECVLGAGGMGEVFRATDTRLNRQVAIKVPPPGVAFDEQMRARFAREARAAAALTHPHICTLHDVGRDGDIDFLVMEYLEGRTLAARLADGPLPLDEAFTYSLEIASALEHAHGHRLVHRDLKPANVMLTASGTKLLDFGLAKFRQAALGPQEGEAARDGGSRAIADQKDLEPPDTDDAPVTRDGTIPGTLRYMSPEQVAGREVDARSDLFSFGAVVFEMLTGRRAFDGDSAASVRAAILEHDPPSVSSLQPLLPPAVDDLVRRCLAKNASERYQTATDVIRELKDIVESIGQARSHAPPKKQPSSTARVWTWVAGILIASLTGFAAWIVAGGFQRSSTRTASGPIRAVAVLPFENASGDSEQEYFADGTTEQLIFDLARIGGLRVISPASVMHYRKSTKPVSTIARELQVDAIVEGSVVRGSEKIRIAAKLIRGATGEVIWAQRFERALGDAVALQNELARTITSYVDTTLQQRAGLLSDRPVDPEVHRQVLLGRHHAAKTTEEGLRTAVQHFNVAIAKDPGMALAHAGLAQAYTELAGYYMDPRDAMPKAKRAAQTALRLDESVAEAHAALGYIHLVYDWDGPAAQRELLRALDLNSTLAIARLNYAAYLSTQARHDEAVREVRRAVDLDPRSIRTHAFGTVLLLFTRRYDEAIDLSRRGLEFEPDSAFTLAFQGVAYAQKGRFEEAVANVHRAAQLDRSLTILALQAQVLAMAGRTQQAEKLIHHVQDAAKRQYFCPYEIACVYVSLGDRDTAYALFRRGTDEHADCMAWLGVEPWVDSFRSDPRYRTLLRRIGLARDPRQPEGPPPNR
jgi:serine/threonine-protein kinase